MKKYILFILLGSSLSALAQIPEDVLKYSYYPQSGTARTLAIGGAMGSLGGDITAAYVNPAGLGNYKTGEFVFTPSYFLNNNKSNFRDSKTVAKDNFLKLGNIGFVFGASDNNNPRNSQAFSISVAQTANFSNTIRYQGYNNYSSGSEVWAEEASRSGLDFDGILASPAYAYGTAPATYTYLIDSFTIGNNLLVKGMPEFVLAQGKALLQQKEITSSGGMYEIAAGYAHNSGDKLFIGGSIGIPIIDYNNSTRFTETDTSADAGNNFNYYQYTDTYSTTGAGINLKMGLIYRPQEHIRLGIALHTPTYMFAMKDSRSSNLYADTENYNGVATASSTLFTNGQNGESKYTMITPWKVLVSGSYVFREVADVRRQKGFITADIEYTGYRNSSFYSANEEPTADENEYYKALNQVIKGQYKGNFNFRVGGELKFNIIMARLGFAYYTNPYKDKALQARRMLLSGGLGYRHKGFFIDVTYVHALNKEADFAYRLADKQNTFAKINQQLGNIAATVGIKF
jgi:hypothetical protein